MKISTLVLVLAGLFCYSHGNAQGLTADVPTYQLVGDTTIHHVTAKIINSGSSTTNIKVHRVDVSLAAGHLAYFCWGITCYGPGTTTSPTAVPILAGDTNKSFIGYLDPQGHTGVSTVYYGFYNPAVQADTVSMYFTYDITIGINELSDRATVSSAYPNPADGLTSLSYTLNSAKDARLIFYNMLGSSVKEVKLTDKQSVLIIQTTDLKSGVYFYSLVADGKSLVSKKLVIAHR